MVEIVYTEHFKEDFKKADKSVKDKAIKQIDKIISDPEIGKPLRHDLKGERTVYVKPFRIIYSYFDRTFPMSYIYISMSYLISV